MESNTITPLNMYLIQLDSNIPIDHLTGHAIPPLENALDPKLFHSDVQTQESPLQVFIDQSNQVVNVKRNHQSIQSRQQIIHSAPTPYINNLNKNLLKLVDPKTLVIKPRSQPQTLLVSQPNTVPQTYSSTHKKNNIIYKKYLCDSQGNNFPKYYINQDSQIIQSNVCENLNNPIKSVFTEEKVHNIKYLGNNQINTTTKHASIEIKQSVILHDTAVKDCSKNESEDLSKKTEVKKRKQNYIHISDKVVPQRAVAVLPTILQLRKGEISPRRTLPARIRFGPVQGINKTVSQYEAQMLVHNLEKPVFLFKDENGSVVHIDTTDKDKSNWISLLQLGDQSTANIWLYEENNALYAFTTVPINGGTVLKIGYSKKYTEDHKFPPGAPVMDLDTVLSGNPKQWWCNECHRTLPSANLLQRHLDVYHKDEIISTRRGYRCQHCKRTFSRLFTVRRHIAQYCLKKPKTKLDKVSETNLEAEVANSTNNDDHRIPSDESFQNFTNSLDFSTNLFDTDRISNLDISMSSKTDNEFNPYSVSSKDENVMSSVSDIPKWSLSGTGDNIEKNTEITEDQMLETCGYCNLVIPKNNRRKHVSECTSRKLECSCGRSFTNKRIFSDHVQKCQKIDINEKEKEDKSAKNKHKCEVCEISFMRRGMLANHMWTKHKTVSTAPVELAIRHYPCIACPKVYRSSSKRDRHITVHHPGAQRVRGVVIKSGVKSIEPASCTLCPRQYATRAKLLQHMRSSHPSYTLGSAIKTAAIQNSQTE